MKLETLSNTFLKNLQRTSLWLRMVAISACPDVFQSLNLDDDCKWPAASTFAYMYQGAEDYILEAMVGYCIQFQVSHLSLHYDGMRVDEGLVRVAPQAIEGNAHDRGHYIQELDGDGHGRNLLFKQTLINMSPVARASTSGHSSKRIVSLFTR